MIIEITRICNIYSKKEPIKLLKKNALIKNAVNLADLSNPSELVNSKGNIIKDKCRVHLKYEGLITINHPYALISSLLVNTFYPEPRPIGFMRFFEEKEIELKKKVNKVIKVKKENKNEKSRRKNNK